MSANPRATHPSPLARRWRALAQSLTERAGKRRDPEATRLRLTAQLALFAAYELETGLARHEAAAGPEDARRVHSH